MSLRRVPFVLGSCVKRGLFSPSGQGGNGAASGGSAPATPTNLAAVGSSTDVAVTWTASSGATSYSVKRSVSGAASFSVVGTPASNSYTDSAPAAGAYDYEVAAVNSYGTSAYTSLKSTPVGMTGWWKADAGTYQNTALSMPATASNDPVGGWADQSGNVNSLLQGTAGLRPTLQLAQINGLPCVRFDGVDDWITAAYTLNQPATMFATLKMRSLGDVAVHDIVADGGVGAQAILGIDNTPRTTIYNGSTLATGTAYANAVYAVMTWLMNNTASLIFANNAQVASGTSGATNPGGFTLGGVADGTRTSAVDVVEALTFAGALSGAMITAVDNYLNVRAGNIY